MAKTIILLLALGVLQSATGQGYPPTSCVPVPNTPSPPVRDYEIAAREQHNFYRGKHQSPGLALHDLLSAQALQCAEYYVNKGSLDSSCPFKNGTGENQYGAWYIKNQKEPSCTSLANSATTVWYNGRENYDYRQPGFSVATGSFTQLVWSSSQFLGVGCALKNGFAVVVALYTPPGNMLSYGNDPNYLFRQNVLPPLRRGKEESHQHLSSFTYEKP
ncbi:unnamed protein product [Allacma fusca]|uniref:SCP domain-containing protein n=1 Tax=Allacma fusca TaxID=39272 RepID=A0A8J2PKJ3_9HEXA|nr:unnamed protein product [Allacma fusca]